MEDFFEPVPLPKIFSGPALAAFGVKFIESMDKRQAEFLAGRYCAQKALEKSGFRGAFSLPSNDDRSPRWPDGFTGSITHSQGIAFAAVATTQKIKSIGIDTEDFVRARDRLRAVESAVISPREKCLFDPISNEIEWHVFIAIVFSLKESIYKCLYPVTQKFFGYGDVEICEIDILEGTSQWKLTRTLNEQFSMGWMQSGRFELGVQNIYTLISI